MGISFSGGLRAAAGFMRGRDDAIARDNATEDREQLRTDRAYQAGQRARTLEQQQREDTLRTELGAIPTEQSADYRNPDAPLVDDDGETPAAGAMSAVVKEKIPQDVQLRQAAAAFKKAGDWGNALKHQQEADKIGWDRSAKMFQDLQAQAADPALTAIDLAKAAAQIYSRDPFAGKVTNVRDDGKGGVIIDAQNRETGQTATKAFANKEALLQSLHAYYSPATYAALQAKRQEALIKAAEKAAEPIKVSPGQQVLLNGKVIHTAPPPVGSEYVGDDANGQPIYRKLPSGAGGARGAGKTEDPLKALNEAWELAATKGADKLTPQQLGMGKRIADQIFTENAGKVPAAVAVEAAIEIALDPTRQEPSIDLATGKIKSVYNHPQTGEFVISHLPPRDLKPEQMTLAVQKLIAAMPAEDAKKFSGAIKSEDASTRLVNEVQAAIDEQVEKDAAANPKMADQIRAQAQATRRATADSLTRKLQLGRQFGPKPAKAGSSVADAVGGAFGGDKTSAAQARLKVGGIRSAIAANPLRPQVQPDEADLAVRAARTPKPADPAAREAKLASLKRLNLTPEAISAMRPSEAKAIVDQYDDVLDAKTLFALRRAAS